MLIELIHLSVSTGSTVLVMEYMANGNLWENLQDDCNNELRWRARCAFEPRV